MNDVLYRVSSLAAFRFRGACCVLALTAFLATSALAANPNTLPAQKYMALRKSLGAAPASASGAPVSSGKYLEVKGRVCGVVSSEGSASFFIESDGQTVAVQADQIPDCINAGNVVRVLVKMGDGPDPVLEAAAFDQEVTAKEKALAEAAKPKPAPSAAPKAGLSTAALPKPGPSGYVTEGEYSGLSSRTIPLYKPYRKAIASFNPRLDEKQLTMITKSILAFSDYYNMDPRFIVALIVVESGFRPAATSPKGAMGLGQLMPGTASGLGVNNAYDPVQNIEASIRLIRNHFNKFGDWSLALSAYNAGPGAVLKHNGIPPYRETQTYVRKVAQLYKALCGP